MRLHRHQPLIVLACVLPWHSPLQAAPTPLVIQVRPGVNSAGEAAILWDLDSDKPVDTATGARFSLKVEPVEHHYSIRLAPFDPLNLTVAPEGTGGWKLDGRHWHPDFSVSLSRTIALNVEPPNFSAFVPADAGDTGGVAIPGQTLDVAGIVERVVPLPTRNGQVTLPQAGKKHFVYVTAPLFLPQLIEMRPEDLWNKDTTRFPPEARWLQPKFGWFSYWQFDVGFGLGLVALLWLAPSALKRRQHERALVSTITSARDNLAASLSVAALSEQTVTTETGRRYLLQFVLGRGAMGAVYRSVPIDTVDDLQPVAIKVLISDSETNRQRFVREIRICQSLTHHGIVKVLDYGQWTAADGQVALFMVMELVSGQTLKDVILERNGPLPQAQVVSWLVEALQALRLAHQAGIVHRDLKPENLMVTSANHIKIMDFGVARDLAEEGLTRTETAMGTPYYMSPEHFQARSVTPMSDIYSMGIIAYELLAGRLPFGTDATNPWSVLTRMMNEAPPDVRMFNPDISAALADTIMRMLERDPKDRGDDALERLSALIPRT